MTDCLFCKIIDGDVPAATVYEDDDVVAFLDLFPINPGHVLVVPRTHAKLLQEVPEAEAEAMMRAAMRIDAALRVAEGIRCDDLKVVISDGPVAGQEIPHCHLHLIPRYEGDAWEEHHGGKVKLSDEELERHSEAVMDALR